MAQLAETFPAFPFLLLGHELLRTSQGPAVHVPGPILRLLPPPGAAVDFSLTRQRTASTEQFP